MEIIFHLQVLFVLCIFQKKVCPHVPRHKMPYFKLARKERKTLLNALIEGMHVLI